MRFGIFAGVAALALAASSLPVSAQPSDKERKQALEIYRTVVEMDTSVEGGRTPEMAKYLADRFRDGGFDDKDIHLIPVDKTAALVVQRTGMAQAEAAKRLRMMARKHGWGIRPDPDNPELVRYSNARPRSQARDYASTNGAWTTWTTCLRSGSRMRDTLS